MRIGVVTAYPDRNLPKSGIAYYSQTVIAPLAGSEDDITIFADLPPQSPALSEPRVERIARNITLVRCWRWGALAPLMLVRAIAARSLDVLHLEYDVYLYGGVVAALLLSISLGILRRLRGIQVTTTLHGVVSQKAITHEMLRENGFVLPFSRIGRMGFRVVYGLFDWASDRLIVLERKLASVLVEEYGVSSEKVHTIPIPLMHEQLRPDSLEAKRRCCVGAKSLLFVGYASHYKGLPLLFDAYDIVHKRDPEIELHVAGSRHPRLVGDPKYQKFYEGLRKHAAAVGARMYDFLPDERLADMLSACSAVVLPYSVAYGGSAALNTALAARRPILVSSTIYFEGALPSQVFEPSPQACADTILRFFAGERFKIESVMERLARSRDVATIAEALQRVRCGRESLLVPTPEETVTTAVKTG